MRKAARMVEKEGEMLPVALTTSYLRQLLLGSLSDRVFLDDMLCPEEVIAIKVQSTRVVAISCQDDLFRKLVGVLRKSVEETLAQFEDEYDFFAPKLVIILPKDIAAKIGMKKKVEPEKEKEGETCNL